MKHKYSHLKASTLFDGFRYVVIGGLKDVLRYEPRRLMRLAASPVRHMLKRLRQAQHCKVCGEAMGYDFVVTDAQWERAEAFWGKRMHGHVLCADCFCRSHGLKAWWLESNDCDNARNNR